MTTGQLFLLVVLGGVTTGVVMPVNAIGAIAVALCLGSLALLAIEWRPQLAGVALMLGGGALAVAHGAAARAEALAPPLLQWVQTTVGADLRAADPVRVRGTLAADAAAGDLGVRLEIRVEGVDAGAGWQPVPGRVQAHVAGDAARANAAAWSAGRAIEAPVLLRTPTVYRNPGGPSLSWQSLRRPFDLTGTIKSAALVDVTPGRWWHEAGAAARRHVREAVRRHVPEPPAYAAGIVTAILIGDRAGLPDEVEVELQMAGTYHVIAISGGNVALLTALCLFAMRAVCRSRRIATLTTLVVVVLYGWVVGGDPSVRRAVMAASVYLLVDLAGLMPPAIAVIGLVAGITALVDPLAVVDVGAWLSFGATLAIVVGAGRIVSAIPATRAKPAGLPPSLKLRRTRKTGRSILALIAATIAAELALVPIQATVFNRVTMAGLVLNLVAIPAMAVLQIAGLVMAICAGWFDAAAAATGALAAFASRILVESAGLVRFAPWVSWRVPPVSWLWCAAYYAAWIALLWLVTRRSWRRTMVAVVATSGVVIVSAPGVTRAAPAAPWLRMTLIDVGQGDAILVQFPTGHSMLVDAGGTPGPFDIGGRVVTPAAWALGVRRLDWLVVTHGDGDHLGGASAVVTDLRPREIWEGIPVPGHRPLDALRRQARDGGAAWRTVFTGQSMRIGPVELDSVHPLPPDWERRRVRNDDSLVLRLRYGVVEVLLTGDAALEFEGRAAPDDGQPALRVLKVAHHGSRTSSSAAFVARYRPEIAVVSLGGQNLFGHPAPDVVARLDAAGARLFRTDRHGAISVETDGTRVRVRTWTGVEWDVMIAEAAAAPPAGS